MLFRKLLFCYYDRKAQRKTHMVFTFIILAPVYSYILLSLIGSSFPLFSLPHLIVTVLLLIALAGVPEKTNELYEHNRKGQAKVARHMFKHRDVIDINVQYAWYWNWAVRVVFVSTTIPILICLPITMGAITAFAALLSGDNPLYAFAVLFVWLIVCGLIFGFFEWIANLTLMGSDHVNDMYEAPQEFAENISVAKAEARRKQAVEDAKRLLAEEERRNQRRSQNYDPQIPYENRSLEDRNYRQNPRFQYNDDFDKYNDRRYRQNPPPQQNQSDDDWE